MEIKKFKREKYEVENSDVFEVLIERYYSMLLIILFASVGATIWSYYVNVPLISIGSSIITMILGSLIILVKKKTTNSGISEKEANGLINNFEGNKTNYNLCLGYEVKKQYGDIRISAAVSNAIKPILIDMESTAKHFQITGTTGSGKTKELFFLVQQVLNQGGGCGIVNGKSDPEIFKTMYALCCDAGREQDFFFLNFADLKNTMSISMFDMDHSAVKEIFSFMLGSKGDSEWGTKALDLMMSILDLLMQLKERNIIFPASEMKNINSYDDLMALEYKNTMRISLVNTFMTSKALVDVIKLFEKLYANEADKIKLDRLFGQDEVELVKYKKVHGDLINTIQKQTNIDLEELISKTFEAHKKDGDDPFYSTGVAIDYWSNILKEFGDTYGKILDSTSPDININDILRGHKVLYITLPGTAGENTKKSLGSIVVGLIKSAYEKIQQAQPLELPFIFFLDEFNSYSRDLKGVGDLMSQTRSKRIAFAILHQSTLNSMDDGKGLERSQIEANVFTKIVLKITENDLIEQMAKSFGKEKKLREINGFVKRDFQDSNDKTSLEQSLSYEETDVFDLRSAKALAPGECFIGIGPEMYRATGGVIDPFEYEGANQNAKVPETQHYPKNRFRKEFLEFLKNETNLTA